MLYSSAGSRKISLWVMQKMQSFVVEESLNSVKAFWLEQEKLIEEIYKVAVGIGKGDENVLKIILFGSLAEKPFMDRRTHYSSGRKDECKGIW